MSTFVATSKELIIGPSSLQLHRDTAIGYLMRKTVFRPGNLIGEKTSLAFTYGSDHGIIDLECLFR